MTSILNELMIAWVMGTLAAAAGACQRKPDILGIAAAAAVVEEPGAGLAEAAGSWRRYRCNDVTMTSLVVMTSQVAMTSLVVMTSSVAMP